MGPEAAAAAPYGGGGGGRGGGAPPAAAGRPVDLGGPESVAAGGPGEWKGGVGGAHSMQEVDLGGVLDSVAADGRGGGGKGGPEGEGEPADRWAACYLCWVFLGMGILFPWNAFITAVDYFGLLYPIRQVDRWFSVVYMAPNLVTEVVMVRFGQRVRAGTRVQVGFWAFAVALLVIPIIDAAGIEQDTAGAAVGGWSFIVTLAAVALTGAADAVAQGSLFGMAANLPGRYTSALCTGTAVSGVVVNICRMVTKAAFPQDAHGQMVSSYIYFGIAITVCFACVYIFTAVLPRLPVMLWHTLRRRAEAEEGAGRGGSALAMEMTSLRGPGADSSSGHHPVGASVTSRSIEMASVKRAELADAHAAGNMSALDQLRVFKKIWVYPVCLCFVYW